MMNADNMIENLIEDLEMPAAYFKVIDNFLYSISKMDDANEIKERISMYFDGAGDMGSRIICAAQWCLAECLKTMKLQRESPAFKKLENETIN